MHELSTSYSATGQSCELSHAAQAIVSFEEVVCAEKENIMDDNAMRAGVSLLGDLATQVQRLSIQHLHLAAAPLNISGCLDEADQ